MLPPSPRPFDVRVAGSTATKRIEFAGKPITVSL